MADTTTTDTDTEQLHQGAKRTSSGPSLSEAEKWERAKFIFPGIVHPDSRYSRTNRSVEFRIWEEIEHKYRVLWIDQTPEAMDDLLSPERGAELCIKLGINQLIVRKRFEVIENLRRELDIPCMTSTLIQVFHLVHTFGIINPYGDPDHINAGDDHRENPGVIRRNYKDKDWQSYLGIRLRPGKTREALCVMKDALEKDNLTDCYVHGTNGKVLQCINKEQGEVNPSNQSIIKGGIRHDFGPGLYAMKGLFLKALAWGVDGCWPLFSDETNVFENFDPNTPMGHNPAIVVFPNPKQYNRKDRAKMLFDVHAKPPFKDRALKQIMLSETYNEFTKKKKDYKGSASDINWKTFLKLARSYYNMVPPGDHVFFGRLHDTQRTHKTDRCEEPIMDPDKSFIQYCFTNPNEMLGTERLFIEFDVAWNEWLSKAVPDVATSAFSSDYPKEDQNQKLTKDYLEEDVSSYDK